MASAEAPNRSGKNRTTKQKIEICSVYALRAWVVEDRSVSLEELLPIVGDKTVNNLATCLASGHARNGAKWWRDELAEQLSYCPGNQNAKAAKQTLVEAGFLDEWLESVGMTEEELDAKIATMKSGNEWWRKIGVEIDHVKTVKPGIKEDLRAALKGSVPT